MESIYIGKDVFMKRMSIGIGLACTIALSGLAAKAQNYTIEDYNKSLIKNGVAWDSSKGGTYLPSFYTGFAPRVEDPNRIHIHLGRGNNLRLTAPLDEYTILTYMYGLKKREALFDQAIAQSLIQLKQQNQLGMYKSVMASSAYNINGLIQDLESGRITREQFYAESLNVLSKLNNGRVFSIRLDLSAHIERWKGAVEKFLALTAGASADKIIAKNPQATITLINELVWGRVNLILATPAIKAKLIEAINNRGDTAALEKSALELLDLATNGRYNFKVLRQGQLQSAIHKDASGRTVLEYSEFTAVYPNGSVKDYTHDRDGNQIPKIREIGALNFIQRSSHDVDHIRSEGFYGYIPKMDYTTTGNGMHNPAVRTSLKSSIYKHLFKDLEIPAGNDTLWIVSRGGVSHGCTRMAAGHILEVRDIFPSNEKRMTQVKYFGNETADYDLFDINGDGQIEVMGVNYLLAYAIAADSGEGYREGAGLIEQSQNREEFYKVLYGTKNQYRMEGNDLIFTNPYISQFILEKEKAERAKAFSIKLNGDFKLYEQAYEKDKMQFYKMSSAEMSTLQSAAGDSSSLGKQVVRLFGRAAGCGPFKGEFSLCNEDRFDAEFTKLATKVTKVK